MKIDVLTLFPDMFSMLSESIIGRAINDKKVQINIINIRDFSLDKHKKCDDTPFGGGAGMVLTPQPIHDAVKSVLKKNSRLIYLSPKGKVFNQSKAVSLSKEDHLILLCGHYEGIDERIIDIFNPELISIGDFVLTGGELAAMAIIDAVTRQIDGVLAEGSLDEESHTNGLLEYPHYTRPQNFMGLEVPEVLRSGNHEEIRKWRQQKSLEETKKYRPDMLKSNK